ncbi:MAG: methyltransferase domain-containing protein [Candidatus Binatia bacterium]|nr:methyltransferase domain-containing protein [Candidatus Binatia bacterium]
MAGDLASFDHVLFYGRPYDTVLEMLLLREEDLVGTRILDCPSGPDAFVAGANARGFDVVGCDPLFAGSAAEIASLARKDINDAYDNAVGGPNSAPIGQLKAARDEKLQTTELFAADFEQGKAEGRYVEASLPTLPFADDSFDIVVSANFLFAYSPARLGGVLTSDTFDLHFHRRAVRELMRVARQEVRLYPVLTIERHQHLHPYAAQIIGQLAAEGLSINLQESRKEMDGMLHQVLILEKSPTA